MRSESRQGILPELVLFSSLFAVVLACEFPDAAKPDPDPTGIDETIPGRVGVNTATEGVDLDPNGYTMTLDNDTRSIQSMGQVSFGDRAPGSYSLGITDIAPNCSLTSIHGPSQQALGNSTPLSITVVTGRTDFYNFKLGCVANLAEVVVFNQTDGDPGVAAYKVTVNGEERDFPIDSNVYFDVRPPFVTVQVTDVPPECFLIGDNPASLEVPFGDSETVVYRIDCTGERGTLRVSTSSTGLSLDSDGYNVSVAGQIIIFPSQEDFSYDFELLPGGPMDVFLTNVAANCTPTPTSPFTATVVVNAVTEVPFEIVCAPAGTVDVSVTTSGADPDPDGYTVTIGERMVPVPSNTTEPVTFERVLAGTRQVRLDGVAPNCTVDGSNPQTATVIVDQTIAVEFKVTCVGAGSLEVTTQTTGGAIPSGGFGLRIGDDWHTIGANETQTFTQLPFGDTQVFVSNEEAENCSVADENPRTVSVVAGQTVSTTFQVSCPSPLPPVLFESDRTGDFNIFAMEADGSGIVRITPDDNFDDLDPSWSWDHDQIVFVSTRGGQSDIWVMDEFGNNPVQLTNTAAVNEDPAFSPDGKKIAYEEEAADGSLEIFIMDADGSNPKQLTNAPGAAISEAPQFTRDGQTILFKSNRSNNDFDVYTIGADGNGLEQLTHAAGDDFDPSYSNDMSTIIFSSQRDGLETLYLMDADGNEEQRFSLPVQFYDWHPVYSTSGDQVIFTSDRYGQGSSDPEDTSDYELWIVNVDGSGLTRLTNNAFTDDDAEFRRPIN